MTHTNLFIFSLYCWLWRGWWIAYSHEYVKAIYHSCVMIKWGCLCIHVCGPNCLMCGWMKIYQFFFCVFSWGDQALFYFKWMHSLWWPLLNKYFQAQCFLFWFCHFFVVVVVIVITSKYDLCLLNLVELLSFS